MEGLNHIPEKMQILITGFLSGSIDKGEVEVLKQWISESDDHLQMFNTLKSTWLLSGKPVNRVDENIRAALRKVKHDVKYKSDKPIIHFWNISRIAVSWVLVFIVGGLLSTYFTSHSINSRGKLQSTTISAPLGSKSQVDLPDGTKVWLNAGSKITYNNSFGGSTREVFLTGEAYFDVKRNEKSPFLVKTNKLVTIKVLGTAFNVKAYPEESYVETTVERGKVQVSKSSPSTNQINTVTLLPKQKLTIECKENPIANNTNKKTTESVPNDKLINVSKKEMLFQNNVETKIYTSWKDGEWIIESESLESIAVKIERSYNISIDFKDPELKKYIFSGILKNETLDQVLELIKLSAPIKYRIEQRNVILTKNRLFDNSNLLKTKL
jgi:transmembrane sensor